MIYAITVHEVAHGLIAKGFGDMTASRQGRLTLNPIAHIDMLGTVILPALLIYLGGLVFGWAKPVPVNPYNFKNRNRAMFFVAIAGLSKFNYGYHLVNPIHDILCFLYGEFIVCQIY